MKLDLTKVKNIKFEDVDLKDRPDFADAYISYAEYDGVPMDEFQLEELNEDKDFVHTKLLDWLS